MARKKVDRSTSPATTTAENVPVSTMASLHDIVEFFQDQSDLDAPGKNTTLAQLLLGTLFPYHVVLIERIEIGTQKGWRVTYRPA